MISYAINTNGIKGILLFRFTFLIIIKKNEKIPHSKKLKKSRIKLLVNPKYIPVTIITIPSPYPIDSLVTFPISNNTTPSNEPIRTEINEFEDSRKKYIRPIIKTITANKRNTFFFL